MDNFEQYINCYLDSIDKFDRDKYLKQFPWINSNLLIEQYSFWQKYGFLDLNNNVIKGKKKQSLVFLDVDGVLNFAKSKETLAKEPLTNLKTIVKSTNSLIILISSWKSNWNKNKEEQFDDDANYLDECLAKESLCIFDKSSRYASTRSFEVGDYLVRFNTNKYVILDDDSSSYAYSSLSTHLVACNYYEDGLNKELTKLAIDILNK